MDRSSILRASTKLLAAALRGGRFSLLAWLIPYENGHVLGKQAENPLSSVGESWGMACRVARGARSVELRSQPNAPR